MGDLGFLTREQAFRGAPKVRKQESPGQSAAPPWVDRHAIVKALQVRNKRTARPCCALAGLLLLSMLLPRAALRSALGFFVCAPLVLRGKPALLSRILSHPFWKVALSN